VKKAVCWDITSCGSCKNQCFSVVTANVVPISPILLTLMMEAISFSEASVATKATLRNFPGDDILHSHRSENLKCYIALTGWAL
jgi:hypothetical protein